MMGFMSALKCVACTSDRRMGGNMTDLQLGGMDNISADFEDG